MIEIFFIIIGLFYFSSIFLALVMYAVIAVIYILKFSLPLLLRLILFVFFGLSVIKPDNRKSFNGTYVVKYLKWNDEAGNVYCTEDKDLRFKRIYFGFRDAEVFTDFELKLPCADMLKNISTDSLPEDWRCFHEVKGWFTVEREGFNVLMDGTKLVFEIRMRKISNNIIKKYFRCMTV